MKDYLYRPSSPGEGEEGEREKALRDCPSLWQVEHDESFDLPKLQEIVRKLGTRQMLRDLELALKENNGSGSNSNESSNASSKDAAEMQVSIPTLVCKPTLTVNFS